MTTQETLFSTLEGIDATYTPQGDLKITSPESDFKVTSTVLPSEIAEALDEYRRATAAFAVAEDGASMAYRSSLGNAEDAARSRLENLYREQQEEIERLRDRIDELEDIVAAERGQASRSYTIISKAALASLKDEQRKDSERLDWLDAKGRFFVALNRHDGRQSGVDESGIPIIYRLWLKYRGGENQSLRDALDALRPITECSVLSPTPTNSTSPNQLQE